MAQAGSQVREVAELCAEAARRTDGAFSAWLPGPDGVAFEPTGLVKGWAVERAFDAWEQRLADIGGYDVLICAGGDVVAGCRRTDTPDWTIGIEDPHDRSRLVRSVGLRRGAVATSGSAARGGHILDPRTGQPASGLRSATVIGPALMWADVYATAAFVHGLDAAGWVATLPDHLAVLVDEQGTVTSSPVSSSPVTSGPAMPWRPRIGRTGWRRGASSGTQGGLGLLT